MDLDQFVWLTTLKKGEVLTVIHIRNNQHQLLKEGDTFICEFEDHRWLAVVRFISIQFYTKMLDEQGKLILRIRDLRCMQDDEKIKFVSITHRTRSGKTNDIDEVLKDLKCQKTI